MIPIREIKEKAREYSVPPSTIERDYAQNWLLAYLSPIKMALKGGTGIRKVFIEHYRFSDDLDFTLLEPMDKDMLLAAVRDSVIQAREACGIQYLDEIVIDETKSGFQVKVKFNIISSPNINIKLDITPSTNECILLPVTQRQIFHHFSDRLKAKVTSYSLEEIIAEKIRSIFQRTRPRDLYDIWQLSSYVDPDKVKLILDQKCEHKNVGIDIPSFIGRRDAFKASWDASLHHQIDRVPDFDLAFVAASKSLQYYLD